MPPKRSVEVLSEEARIKSAYALRQGLTQYSWFRPGYLFYIQQLEKRILNLLRSEGLCILSDKRILEIGCGHGSWLRDFIKWGACPSNMTGIDLLPDRIEKARQLCPQEVELHCGNASNLPFTEKSFDVVAQFTVFSSILDADMKKAVASEMLRVLKADGCILWYDFYVNNPRNSHTRAIRKSEMAQLFPDCFIEMKKVSLIPPLTRILATYTWLGCYALEQLRVFNTHYLGIIKQK